MNGWEFMGRHPVLTFFLALFAVQAFGYLTAAIAIAFRLRKIFFK
jgi:hypothetical protein